MHFWKFFPYTSVLREVSPQAGRNCDFLMAIFRFCKTSGILRLQNVRHKGLDARVPYDSRTPRNSNAQIASTLPAPPPLKANNRNTRKRQWNMLKANNKDTRTTGAFIINPEHVSQLANVFTINSEHDIELLIFTSLFRRPFSWSS